MRVYNVIWEFDKSSDFDGRLPLSKKCFSIVVLADSRFNALRAFELIFHHEHLTDGISVDFGNIRINHMKVDSRNIICNYLMLADMRRPLNLVNLKNYRDAFGC